MSRIILEKHLKSVGTADTRAYGLASALDIMHRELCYLDQHNLAVFDKEFPGVLDAVRKYARLEGCSINKFE